MTTAYGNDWLRSLRPQPSRMSAPEYESLSEEISRAIEVVDGYVLYCEAPSPEHHLAGRRLATMLEQAARRAMAKGHECLTVNTDVDLRLQDVPLLNRRPDVILYRCLDRENNERLCHRALPTGSGFVSLQACRHFYEGRERGHTGGDEPDPVTIDWSALEF